MNWIKTILLGVIMTSCHYRTADSYFEEALKLEEQKKYKEAIVLLDKAINKRPEFIEAIMSRGADKAAIQQNLEAIKDYELVLSIDKKNVLSLFNIALNKNRMEDYNGALEYLNKAIKIKGGPYLIINKLSSPFSTVDENLYDVEAGDIFCERGITYYQMDSLNKAAADFNICIQNNYNIAEANYFLSQVYFRAGRLKEACNYLSKAVQMGYKDILPDDLTLCNKTEAN